jgi:hypothetical protein
MHFTRFATFLKFPGIKVGRADFLYRGQLDPRPLTSGPEDPRRHPRWTRSTLVSGAGQGHVGQAASTPAGSPATTAGARAGAGGRKRDAERFAGSDERRSRPNGHRGTTPVTAGAAASGSAQRGGLPERKQRGKGSTRTRASPGARR